ncbi:S-adenosylmethionine decarboxylase [Pseudooceanicola batsensis HTCC2597]|uniref:S-adenosylmethionine decarboxylase n=1 Tax=Pseudooceanicola batsensis (strain ATCC BAA-863 / DSM 15984 / KCTC 12145 / HTCC2597) TaxID=252305 RepID=A3TUH9_PSEBH|nr:adenosylmethionine decarboxylase [Pseudooceanicola batsensis]EAQ04175.1 S-adenosylmethionine decarboxylase [Pseudooceanicola batsensis HTCC2597]
MDDFSPGTHLLVDHRGGAGMTDPDVLEQAMRGAAEAAEATVLSAHFHQFPDSAGVTGVLLLAESHISVHTWPEHDYAAFDIFVCGEGQGKKAADFLARALLPDWTQIRAVQRNHFSHAPT